MLSSALVSGLAGKGEKEREGGERGRGRERGRRRGAMDIVLYK